MKRYMPYIIEGADIRVEEFLQNIETDRNSLLFGGLRGEIWDAKATVYALTTAVAALLNKGSRFYMDRSLSDKIMTALEFVRRSQREDDGSFDYASCNFRSAPDTAFCFKRLAAAYKLLKMYNGGDDILYELEERYKAILRKSLIIISEGGFHTPNHRWAITAALFSGARLFASENSFSKKLLERAGKYLAEGIDGDADGDYAEHSTGNYNAVVNAALLTCYEESGDESYLGFVSRNLDMMLYYLDDGGIIFTQNSTRQDRGKEAGIDKYFYQYLYMAKKTGEEKFAAAAHQMIADSQKAGRVAPDCLYLLMLHKELEEFRLEVKGYLSNYRRYFAGAGVYRVKKAGFIYTVLKNKSNFLYIDFNGMHIGLRIGESLAYVRNFIPSALDIHGDTISLHSSASGDYYLPFDEVPATSDWWQMEHSKRRKLQNPRLDITLLIKELEEGLEISLKSEGLDRLPLRVEIDLPPDVSLYNEHFYLKTNAGGSMIVRDSDVFAAGFGKKIRIGKAFGEHEFGGHYSGEEKNTAGYTLRFNAYTPVDRKFVITAAD